MFGGLNRESGLYNSTLYELIIDEKESMLTLKEVSLGIEIYPEGRVDHELVSINNQYFLLIGGQKVNKKIFKDIWVFDLLMLRWTRIEPANGPFKEIHSFSTVLYNNNVYVIGGML